MAKKLAYERYCWFHGQVKDGRFPNATSLAERFEISGKQAQRDIEFMRDRLDAPLVYNYFKRGYEYEDISYELPPVWFNEDELLALCLALRLSATIPDRKIKDSLRAILKKFFTFRTMGPSHLEEITEKVSVKNIQYYRVNDVIFRKVVSALFENQPLRITYYTPHKSEITERVIIPLHLLCYMGSWHLISFCTMRGGLRDFALSRIKTIELVSGEITLPDSIPSIKEYIRMNFGLFTGDNSIEVGLRFSPDVSKWISEQIWHATQEVSLNPDGSLGLKFPVSDLREIRREILKYGASVEVLYPEELRQEIKNEIKKLGKLYR